MTLSTLREWLVAPRPHDDAAPAAKNLTTLLAGHRRILLVLDRADDLDAILRDVVERAGGSTLEIVALVVLPEWSASQLELRVKAHLRRVAEEITTPAIGVSAEVVLGEPVAAVLAAAERRGVDLIAMRNHAILGEVLRRSSVPGVVVPAPCAASTCHVH
jgi:nucleotide-binding universal stress UspA family protein